MTKVFDEAGSFRIDSRVGLISEVFNGDFAAFVAGLKVSFLCFFRYLNLELFGAKSWFSKSDSSFRRLFSQMPLFHFFIHFNSS